MSLGTLGTLGYAGYVLVSRIVCKRENVICETQIALRGSSRGQQNDGSGGEQSEGLASSLPFQRCLLQLLPVIFGHLHSSSRLVLTEAEQSEMVAWRFVCLLVILFKK